MLLERALNNETRGLGGLHRRRPTRTLFAPLPSARRETPGERSRRSRQPSIRLPADQGSRITLHAVDAADFRIVRSSTDKSGEQHYDCRVSAFIKSMRGSDPDALRVYWMMRMLEAGDDPLFVSRRMIVFASEDIGNADPRALLVATAADAALRRVGLPEATYALAQASSSYPGLRAQIRTRRGSLLATCQRTSSRSAGLCRCRRSCDNAP